MNASKKAELEAKMAELDWIKKEKYKEAKRLLSHMNIANSEHDKRNYEYQAEEYYKVGDEADREARAIQKQLDAAAPSNSSKTEVVKDTDTQTVDETPPDKSDNNVVPAGETPDDVMNNTSVANNPLPDQVELSQPSTIADTSKGESQAPSTSNNTDNTEHISLEIPTEVMFDAVEKIVLGWRRIDVAKDLLRQDPLPEWLLPISDMKKTQSANLLSGRLRNADPSSKTRFSETKYRKHADAVLEIAKKALHDHIYGLIAAQIETFERTDKEYERLIEVARQQIDSSEDAAENRQHIKLWNSLNKERRTHTNTLLTRLHHILASRTTSDE